MTFKIFLKSAQMMKFVFPKINVVNFFSGGPRNSKWRKNGKILLFDHFSTFNVEINLYSNYYKKLFYGNVQEKIGFQGVKYMEILNFHDFSNFLPSFD